MSIAQALAEFFRSKPCDDIASLRAVCSEFNQHIYVDIKNLTFDTIWNCDILKLREFILKTRNSNINLKFLESNVHTFTTFLEHGGFNISQITSFDLSKCTQVSFLSDFIAQLPQNIKTLDLSNQHMGLFVALNIPHIKSLTVSNCQINSKAFMNMVNGMTHLEHLNISSNHVYDLNCMTAFSKLISLTSLNLSNNAICDGSMEVLGPSLKCMKNLKHLDLSTNILDCSSIPYLNELKSLETLEVGDCFIQNQGISLLNIGMLTKLDLSKNVGCTHFGLTQQLKNCTRLQYLDMSACDLHLASTTFTKSMSRFITTLEDLTELRVLKLEGNCLSDEFMGAMTPVFKKLTKLQHLDVSNNNFGSKTDNVMALRHLHDLKSLDFGNNYMTFEYQRLFVDELKDLKSLKKIRFDNIRPSKYLSFSSQIEISNVWSKK